MQPPHKKAAGTNLISRVVLYYFGNLIACVFVSTEYEMINSAYLPLRHLRDKKKKRNLFLLSIARAP